MPISGIQRAVVAALDYAKTLSDDVRAGVEQSLRLMKTDRIDLVQFHRSLTPNEFDDVFHFRIIERICRAVSVNAEAGVAGFVAGCVSVS